MRLSLFTLLLVVSMQTSYAQIWKKVQDAAQRTIERKAEEKTEEGIDNIFKKKDKKKTKSKKKKSGTVISSGEDNDETETTTSESDDTTVVTNSKNASPEIWRNFKFIPGEKVIFYDDLKTEEVGEFPSRWDLADGGAEVALFNGEKVIIPTAKYDNIIKPLFNKLDYLPDEFTIEFDVYIDDLSDTNEWTSCDISFKEKSFSGGVDDISIDFRQNKITGSARDRNDSNETTFFDFQEVDLGELNQWHHIALSYNKKKLKLYYDGHRVLNLPNFKKPIRQFALSLKAEPEDKRKIAIKNIRIAHGGGSLYKRIVADGKYVTNGILFDSGKATIKPQSLGVINKIVNVLKENPDWEFEIIGHTDNDGDNASNQKLSENRAKAVKEAIVSQGIKANRLSTSGKGESAPLNTNSSAEEKANNRRVEFIKK